MSKEHDATNDIGTIESLSKFYDGKILVNAAMESGCKPLLTIRFAPSSENSKMLWSKSSVTVKNPGIVPNLYTRLGEKVTQVLLYCLPVNMYGREY